MIKKTQLINKLQKCDDKQIVTFDPVIDSKISFITQQIRLLLRQWSNITLIIIKNN